jgi:hypothetical protein
MPVERSRDLFERVVPRIYWDDDYVAPHRDKPWMAEYLADRYQVAVTPNREYEAPKMFAVAMERLGHHALIVGGSGGGKTRLAMHLIREQLRAGCSVVILDTKDETIMQALAITEEIGLSRDDVVLLWPREASYGVPGWNPFLGDPATLFQRVTAFVDIMAGLFANSWGPRLEDILRNAATVVAAQSLSLIELAEFLRNDEYRKGFLLHAKDTEAYRQYPEQHRYFEVEFAAMSKSERSTAVSTVMNKLRVFTTTKFLRALFCDTRQNLDLSALWERQKVVLVHLDTVSLGEPGVRVLVGLLTNALYATALRMHEQLHRRGIAPVPVVLSLDELETQERYAGRALTEVLNKARSYHLRLLATCQYLDQLSDLLRGSLLANTAFRAFFRLGGADARLAAPYLAPGFGTQPLSLSITCSAKTADGPVMETKTYDVVDADGVPLGMDESLWAAFKSAQGGTHPERCLAQLEEYATKAEYPLTLWLANPVDSGGEFHPLSLLKNVRAERCLFHGPKPLRLAVRFPRPKVSVTKSKSEEDVRSDIARELQQLPRQHAMVKVDTGETALVKVTDIVFPAHYPAIEPYLIAIGRPSEAIIQMEAERMAAIEHLSVVDDIPVQPAEPQPPPARPRPSRIRRSPEPLGIPLPTAPPEIPEDDSI